MYVSRLRLWNFRKFGSAAPFDLLLPHLDLNLKSGLNLLIGENDSGKTAIIDALKLVLKTHSLEWLRIEDEDFFEGTSRLRIECYITALSDDEARNFTEWLGWDGRNPYLKLMLDVTRIPDRILPAEVKAGADDEGLQLSAEARDKLKITYLRPLRDAENELSSRRNSRLSQILHSHQAFNNQMPHRLVTLTQQANAEVAAYFDGKDSDGNDLPVAAQGGKELKTAIDQYLTQFSGKKTAFSVNSQDLKQILESLSLLFDNGYNLGLGSHNLLCIAAELLHLAKNPDDSLRLGLIEEIEAHLHPQVQMQVIETLQSEAEKNKVQLLITSHSPNIGSKIHLNHLIICQKGRAFPMGADHTLLTATDYSFLQRFLDTTKANLFFARGVILVEGWAEELILPVLAKKIGFNLTERGVSVVNVGNTAFLRYAGIFKRRQQPEMEVKVSVVTDVDIKPLLAGENIEEDDPNNPGHKRTRPYTQPEINGRLANAITTKEHKYNGQCVRTFVSPLWTLEYCIASSPKLRRLFYLSVLKALREQKIDEGVQDLRNYDNAIANIATHFTNWSEPAEKIAFDIYNHILSGKTTLSVAKEKISKAIVAQMFARELEIDASNTDYRTETSLTYLFDAITYAANN
ncbi:ATP-dependent endonuclease [Chitinophaga sp. S165]|uniref:ATP-dependent nuclease n=1 Tax=Chitinophaga sp. S165 TaxID=2135462 RepID=UPI000D718EA8|nr:AAA family ATPase [Chitinophaga sp. S165]PWV55541.1 putative ATP-dependent endonuclease of OLD family [Chitinophaga sp. S165]